MAIIIATVFALGYFIFNKEEWKTRKTNYTAFLLFGGLYLGVIAGLLNSSNISPALFDLEQKLAWIIFPAIFLLGPQLSKKESAHVILSFIVSLTLVSIVSMFTEGFQILKGGFVWKDWGNSVPIDRVYLGMYLCFAVITLYYTFLKNSTGKKKILFLAWAILLLASMLNAFPKMSFVVLIVLLFLYSFLFLLKRSRVLGWLAAALFMAASATFLTTTKDSMIVNAILNQKAIDAAEVNHLISDSFNARILNWKCAIDVLSAGNNWIMGVGTGDVQPALDNCYVNKLKIITPWFLEARFNPHNEYFSLWLNYGFLFLALFLAQLFYFLTGFYKQGLIPGVSFVIIVGLSCLTESVLETQKGIIFYSFFSCLLPYTSSINSKSD